MTARLRLAARALGALVVAVAVGFVVFYAGAMVLLAVFAARVESRWWPVYVYDYGEQDYQDSRGHLIDIYAHEPLSVGGWLGLALLVATALAIVVWGMWIIGRTLVGVLGRERTRGMTRRSLRLALRAFLVGIVALSAYSLGIFLWDWIEWHSALDGGLALLGDPKPGPNPAFDPWQIPLGIVAFTAIGALALLGLRALRKRVRT